MNFVVRSAEPADAEALHRIYACPNVISGTLQVPYASLDMWRKRLSESADRVYRLAACAEGQVVGYLELITNPASPRRRHAASLLMAVHDDWQGKGVGTA